MHNNQTGDYEFSSILFLDDSHSKPFIIELTHLSKYSNNFESIVHIQDYYPEQNKNIKFEKLKLIHIVNGNVLKEDNIKFSAYRRTDNKTENKIEQIPNEYRIHSGDWNNNIKYSKQYKLKKRPRKIEEYIYLEFTINGEEHTLEKSFQIRYKFNYSFWDLLKFASSM